MSSATNKETVEPDSQLLTQTEEIKCRFSVLTNTGNKPLNKTIDVDDAGKLIKSHPDPMYRGLITHVVKTMEELPKLLTDRMEKCHALCHGVVKKSEPGQAHNVVTREIEDKVGRVDGVVARSKKNISFSGSHLSMLDHDPDSQCPSAYLPPAELIKVLAGIDPQWKNPECVVAYSTGSHIYLDGQPITVDDAGYHLYFHAANAEDLLKYSKAMFKQTVLNGHGWFKLARNGAMLLRSCFDGYVFSPERIDFTAAPTFKSDRLSQKRPEPEYFLGNVIDCSQISEVDQAEFDRVVNELKADPALLNRSADLRDKYIRVEAEELVKATGVSHREAIKIVTRRCDTGDLLPDDIIYFQQYGAVKVRDVLSKLEKYNLEPCADPIEPEEGNGKAKFYANADKKNPLVRSFLHGESNYFLQGGKKEKQKKENEWPEPEPIKSVLPPVAPMKNKMIPESFRAWVTDASERMQVPPDYFIVPLLVVCSSIIGTSCRIRPKQNDDWSVVPNLWGGIVGPPSMMKTPSLNEAVNKTLGRLETAARLEHEEATNDHEILAMTKAAEIRALKGAIEKAAKEERVGKNKGKNPSELAEEMREMQAVETPTERRYKTNDSSIEKIVELLQENPRGLLYFRDEIIGLFKRMERAGNEQDRAFMLEAWNGDGSHVDDRIGRGTIRADNICLSLLGGIQPDKIAGYLHGAIVEGDNDGFVQRLQLMVYPDAIQEWEYIDRWPDADAKNRAYNVIEALAEFEIQPNGEDSEEEPFLRFSEGGQEIFKKWLTWLQREKLTEETDHTIILEHLAKYRSLMPSLALLFHLVEAVDAGGQGIGPVSEQAAKMAAAWCQYLESHARRIYSLAINTGQTGGATLAKKIEKKVLKNGFKLRDIQMKKWSLLTSKELIKEALNYLMDKNWIRESVQKKVGKHGGRPAACAYLVNPKIFLECTE